MLSRVMRRVCSILCVSAFFVSVLFAVSVSLSLAGQFGVYSPQSSPPISDESEQLFSQAESPGVIDQVIKDYVPNAQLVGQGRLTVFIWDVYDAFLYAPGGQWHPDRPFALKLLYLRRLYGDKIAQRSTIEIRNQGFGDEDRLATWDKEMERIFPDVDEGVSLTGIYTDTSQSLFFLNNQEIGVIGDPEFGRQFFGIWLNENTSEPDLRRQLLGAR